MSTRFQSLHLSRRRLLAPIVAIAFVAVAMPAASQARVVRDSAGVRIVENPPRANAPIVFALGAKTADIGGPSGNPDEEFNRGFGLAGLRLAGGTVVVPDVVRLQYFDMKGASIAKFGRSGAGPNEFRSLAPAEFCRTRGDTLVAGDFRNGRFAVIHDRGVVRTIPYTSFGGAVAGCFDDGHVLMQGGLPAVNAPSYNIRLHRLRLDGSQINDFGEIVLRSPDAITGFIQPTVRVSGQRVYVGDGAISEVRVYSAAGRLQHVIRTADRPQTITADDVERALSRQRDPTVRERTRQRWRPETYPTYQTFHVDPGGQLWIQDFPHQPRRTDREGWTAFDLDGRTIGKLEIPSKMGDRSCYTVGFGSNEAQIVCIDPDGFSHLAFYQIQRVLR